MKQFLIIAVTALLLSSCMRYQDIKFVGIDQVKMGKIGMNETTMEMNLIFNNPNKLGALLNSAGGKAWIQDIYIGDFLLNEDVKIPARSDFSVPVRLKVNLKELVNNSLNLIMRDSVTIRLDGNARLSKGSIIKNFPLRYNGKKASSELLSQFKL
ncbi:hypothetical protein [Niabella drilacis]|uniref:LEA14-like dessication related protein n=1 Tax=Niabella drilacis (strain DSM 25811 / CCM 8410 / CCUG 62505 / LMG 26954 / E90) TaxID=1285928 RepID=A0A1G6WT60_NIADE|nr:hypothetical protein [Niabella drilacis]SDD68286.1 LEA14-like dessication related protein [Niabella drilacis]